eukprot:1088238-Amphidinium_carterae.2
MAIEALEVPSDMSESLLSLRPGPAVTAELRDLRNYVGKEQESKLLPPFLWQVVSNVLKGQ